jgi:uncharacterized protein involved in oxidation of intracellular sulfur
MRSLIIINDAPYGNERRYNPLRVAHALLKEDAEVTVFLMADAVSAAIAGQKRLKVTAISGVCCSGSC